MSRTIELCSKHLGRISFTVGNTPSAIVFENKRGVGHAMVTEEEARFFLGLGKDYWLPGRPREAAELAEAPDPLAWYATVEGVAGLREKLATIDSAEQVMTLVAQESKRPKTRKLWMDALDERLAALTSKE